MGQKYDIGKVRADNVAIGNHAGAEYGTHADPERAATQAEALRQIRQLIELLAGYSKDRQPVYGTSKCRICRDRFEEEKTEPFPYREPYRKHHTRRGRSDSSREGDRRRPHSRQPPLTIY